MSSDILFTNNPAQYRQVSGLYVNEQNPPAQVGGVSLNTPVFVGECVRGPTGSVQFVSSPQRFSDIFGERNYVSGSAVVGKVWKHLLNKQIFPVGVLRVAPSASTSGVLTVLSGTTASFQLTANGPGAWAGSVAVAVQSASDGNASHFNLVASYNGKQYVYPNIDISTSTSDNSLQVIGDDAANLFTFTKLASGRPGNLAATPMLSASDGNIADADYTSTSTGIQVAAQTPGYSIVDVAGYSTSAVKTTMNTLAAASSDRVFLIGPDSETVSAATAQAEAQTFNNDRLVYCFNHAYTQDPTTATLVLNSPTGWMAAVLANTPEYVHPGDADNKRYLAGITKLYNEAYARGDYVAFYNVDGAGGIAALQRNSGFVFRDAPTTSGTSGRKELTRRRMVDYIQLSLADALDPFTKKQITPDFESAVGGICRDFLGNLKSQQRDVKDFLVDQKTKNTQAQIDAGEYHILLKVKLYSFDLALVLDTQIGTTVTVTDLSA